MKSSALFNKIWIVESLSPGDLKTGENLYKDRVEPTCFQLNEVESKFCRLESKEDFMSLLKKIQKDTKEYGKFPIIHIECHGSEQGLTMANNDQISWKELRDPLIQINMASKLNLLVVLAACNGANLIKTVSQLDRAPFFALIGPTKDVTTGSIEKNFDAFYKEFLSSYDGDKAIATLNNGKSLQDREYHFFPVMSLFVEGFKKYYQENCVGKALQSRVENLLSKAMSDPLIRKKGITFIRRNIKQGLKDVEHAYNNYLNKFFMTDIYEENKERFNFPYDEYIAKKINEQNSNKSFHRTRFTRR